MKLPENENWTHKITGRIGLIISSVVCAFAAIGFGVVVLVMFNDTGSLSLALFFVLFALVLMIASVVIAIRYMSFMVRIGEMGFFLRTKLPNGRYYMYSEIQSCEKRVESFGVSRTGDPANFTYYFAFTDKDGNKREFQYDKKDDGEQVDVLAQRINKYIA